MKTERRWLVDSIRQKLLPELLKRGFVAVAIPKPRNGVLDRELVVSLPFGLLRRHDPRGLAQVEIQLSSYGGAGFSLNIGLIPGSGIDSALGHIPADEALVTWLDEFFTLYSHPRSFGEFAVKRRWWSRREITAQAYDALVGEVVELLPEVDRLFADGQVGPHVRRTTLRRG